MQGGKTKIYHKELSYQVVGVLYEVYNELGYGYQEKYYERAIDQYFKIKNIKFIRQAPFKIAVKGKVIGRYLIDFIIENKIVLEIKRGNYFSKKNIEQIRAYLAATNFKLAMLANFTPNGVKIFRLLNPKFVNL